MPFNTAAIHGGDESEMIEGGDSVCAAEDEGHDDLYDQKCADRYARKHRDFVPIDEWLLTRSTILRLLALRFCALGAVLCAVLLFQSVLCATLFIRMFSGAFVRFFLVFA